MGEKKKQQVVLALMVLEKKKKGRHLDDTPQNQRVTYYGNLILLLT